MTYLEKPSMMKSICQWAYYLDLQLLYSSLQSKPTIKTSTEQKLSTLAPLNAPNFKVCYFILFLLKWGLTRGKKGEEFFRLRVVGLMEGGDHLASLYIPYIDIYGHIPYKITSLYFCITVLPLQNNQLWNAIKDYQYIDCSQLFVKIRLRKYK